MSEQQVALNTETQWQRRRRHLRGEVRHQLRCLWGRTGYRPTARLLHRLNLHHTRTSSPMWPDGSRLTRCDWCGLSKSSIPKGALLAAKQASDTCPAVDTDPAGPACRPVMPYAEPKEQP